LPTYPGHADAACGESPGVPPTHITREHMSGYRRVFGKLRSRRALGEKVDPFIGRAAVKSPDPRTRDGAPRAVPALVAGRLADLLASPPAPVWSSMGVKKALEFLRDVQSI
jgi:hypothetical protein